ncbi:MAG: hypothetical protein DHS20C19_24360 [Acidimicrobiales bacterium]|nr:MAG: hypothetical protein DHS20C19_24360 [Acidimicrobiales bacterium]
MTVPDTAVHYFVRGRPPFLNLSDVAEADQDRVLAALAAEHAAGRNERRFGRLYLDLRAQAEQRLREAFAAAGGVVERAAPHYFTLGESPWFRRLSPDMDAIVIPLDQLPESSTSVTWWDSFAAMAVGEGIGLPVAPDELRGRVHRLTDIPDLADRHGLPGPPADDPSDPLVATHTFVEIQVWSDAPLAFV